MGESVGGWIAGLRRARNRAETALVAEGLAEAVMIPSRLQVFPTTEASPDRFDQLVKMELNVARPDLRTAAALEPGATVVTDDLLDFGRVPGVRP